MLLEFQKYSYYGSGKVSGFLKLLFGVCVCVCYVQNI